MGSNPTLSASISSFFSEAYANRLPATPAGSLDVLLSDALQPFRISAQHDFRAVTVLLGDPQKILAEHQVPRYE
ncbi:MAG TPA: hypothetical protein VGO18_40365 [Steroidobacteraceae bacterium]|nr:hypothetical protein [Steroidobacteraceae bacterium]